MRITIVMGFFLPMPPAAGGATEKSWTGLAREFAARGHVVTIVSRTWPGWPEQEFLDGVHHLRVPGFPHTGSLARNLWRDFRWSRRVGPKLPAADVTIVNCLALPIWLRRRHSRAGRVVVMPGRMPKGQYRLYRDLDRVLAVSTPVRTAVLAENPRFGPVTRVSGYPIDWRGLARRNGTDSTRPVTIGYVGRIHREKGLELLAAAVVRLARRTDLPPWKLMVCGPHDVARGGSGEAYAQELQASLQAHLPAGRLQWSPPIFDAAKLADVYREIDVFCYPSESARGETFGVAVAEAMAAGAVPVVSRLPCFADFVEAGVNGYVFDHTLPQAADALAGALGDLLANPSMRRQLAAAAIASTERYDFAVFAERLLEDFSTLK